MDDLPSIDITGGGMSTVPQFNTPSITPAAALGSTMLAPNDAQDIIRQILTQASQNEDWKNQGANIINNQATGGANIVAGMQPVGIQGQTTGQANNPGEFMQDIAAITGIGQAPVLGGGMSGGGTDQTMDLYKTRATARTAQAGQINDMIRARGETAGNLLNTQTNAATNILGHQMDTQTQQLKIKQELLNNQIDLGKNLLQLNMQYAKMGVDESARDLERGNKYYAQGTPARAALEADAQKSKHLFIQSTGRVPMGQEADQIYSNSAAEIESQFKEAGRDIPEKDKGTPSKAPGVDTISSGPGGAEANSLRATAKQLRDPTALARLTPEQQVAATQKAAELERQAATLPAETREKQATATNTELTAAQNIQGAKMTREGMLPQRANVEDSLKALEDLKNDFLAKPGIAIEERIKLLAAKAQTGDQIAARKLAELQLINSTLTEAPIVLKGALIPGGSGATDAARESLSHIAGSIGDNYAHIKGNLLQMKQLMVEKGLANQGLPGGAVTEAEFQKYYTKNSRLAQGGALSAPVQIPDGAMKVDKQGNVWTMQNGKPVLTHPAPAAGAPQTYEDRVNAIPR